MKFCLFIILNFFSLYLSAQLTKADSIRLKDSIEKAAAGGSTNIKGKKQEAKADEKKSDSADTNRNKQENTSKMPVPSQGFVDWAMLVAVVGLLIIMACVLGGIFSYVKTNQVFIGHNTIKLIGFVMLLPSICIVSLISSEAIGGTVLATLLGTIAGYVLSRNQDNSTDGSSRNNEKAGAKPISQGDVDLLKEQIQKLKDENEKLKKPE